MSPEERVRRVLESLRKVYPSDIVEWWKRRGLTPFQFMLLSAMSQKTRGEAAFKAVMELSKIVKEPSDLLDSRLEDEVRKVVERTGLLHRKLEALRGLAEVLQRYGGVEGFLRLDWVKAREELLKVSGLGSKTVDVILMHLWRAPLMPVDANILRVLKRVGLAEEKDDIYSAREKVEPLIPEEERAWAHLALLDVGRRFCKPRRPRCSVCPLSAVCSYADRR